MSTSEKPPIWVDLDATLARYTQWEGVEVIGEPLPGAREFVKDLRKDFRVGIFTCRTKADLTGRDGETPEQLAAHVWAWAKSHGIRIDDVYTGQGKPFGVFYVDDRGVNCEPQADVFAYDRALREIRAKLKTTH